VVHFVSHMDLVDVNIVSKDCSLFKI